MKALKIIISIIVILVAIVLIVALFLPKKTIIEKEVTISAPIEVIFGQLNCQKNSENWSPFGDSNTVVIYEGPECGVGSKQLWDEGKGNTGTQTIVESEEFSKIKIELIFREKDTASNVYELEKIEEGVIVKWSFEMDAKYPIGRWIGKFFVKSMLDKLYEKGLNNLKDYIEKLPPPPPPEFTISEIEEKAIESTYALSVKDSSLIMDIGPKMGEMFGKLMTYVGENQIEPIGSPFSVYYSWKPEGINTYTTAIPVAEGTVGTDGIDLIQTYAGNVMFITFTGPYEKTEAAWNAMDEYLKTNEKVMNGAPWEVYLKGPSNKTESAKYVTQIFFPIK